MTKLIRFDDVHFGYLTSFDLTSEEAWRVEEMFTASYPGKRLIVMQADEFIDLTGQYEIVPMVAQPDQDPGPIPTEANRPSALSVNG